MLQTILIIYGIGFFISVLLLKDSIVKSYYMDDWGMMKDYVKLIATSSIWFVSLFYIMYVLFGLKKK